MNRIDPWHYTGSSDRHSCPLGQEMMALIQKKWTKQDFTPTVGSAGYLRDCTSELKTEHWCTDKFGRMVFTWDGKVVFQRYTKGHHFMCGETYPYSSIFRKEMVSKLLSQLKE